MPGKPAGCITNEFIGVTGEHGRIMPSILSDRLERQRKRIALRVMQCHDGRAGAAMGISARVVHKRGDQVGDSVNDPADLLHKLLPSPDDESYRCLGFIDWYGKTTFNRYQITSFLRELARIGMRTDRPEERALLARLEALALLCKENPNRLLEFLGD